MQGSRRDILKLGAASLIPVTTAKAEVFAAGSTPAIQVPNDGRLRLLSYEAEDGRPSIGVAHANGHVISIASAARSAGVKLSFDPNSMVSLIEAGPDGLAQVREAVSRTATQGPLLSEIKILPPIPAITRNIYAVGWNYLDHFEEGKAARKGTESYPEHPVFFTKAVHTLNGPFDPIPYNPKISEKIDWECELAVIIGKKTLNVPESEALNHVFGYSVLNDTTARDIQQKKHGGQWFKGKSLDKHGPMGPWIIPAADLDPANVRLLLRVNGTLKQDANTQQMYFKVPRLIAELSEGLTLEPGDIIATGTPPGVGYARTPPEFLKPGDIMESEIVEIGSLRNTIQAV